MNKLPLNPCVNLHKFFFSVSNSKHRYYFICKKKKKIIIEYNYLAGKSLSSANVDQYQQGSN